MCRSIFFLLLLAPFAAFSQGLIHLDTRLENNQWQLFLVPEDSVKGVLSNVQFTLAWQQGGSLPVGSTPPALSGWIDMIPAGPDTLVSGWWHRTYASFGTSRLEGSAAAWVPGAAYVIWNIPANQAPPQLTASNQAMLSELQTGFYAEVDGYDVTGDFLTTAVAATLSPGEWRIYPNPANDFLTIDHAGQSPLPATASLFSITGERILHFDIGALPRRLYLHQIPAGMYILSILPARNTPPTHHKVMVR